MSDPSRPGDPRLTHVDGQGAARMVDVGGKDTTRRAARACARVRMSPATAAAVERGDAPKGEVLATARLAGIQAAKQAGLLIPLAHPIGLTFIDVSGTVRAEQGLVELTSEVHTIARTGVEMEAMTACAVAALTVYDMVKGLERGVQIEQVVLLEKRGGRHGDWRRAEEHRAEEHRADWSPTEGWGADRSSAEDRELAQSPARQHNTPDG